MMHPPKPPSIDHGIISFVWGLALGAFIWAGLLAIGISRPTAAIVAVVAGCAIFLAVRLYGEDEPRRPVRRGRAR